MIVGLVGPSASGKTTLARALCEWSSNVRPLLSYTTRNPRESDLAGEYTYISEKEFSAMSDEFAWIAGGYGNRYGTHRKDADAALKDDGVFVGPILVGTIPDVFRFVGPRSSELCFINLRIDDKTELRRRMVEDKKEGIEKRLASVNEENEEAERYAHVMHPVDATLPREILLEQTIEILNLFHRPR